MDGVTWIWERMKKIAELEKKMKQYQGKDFQSWHHCYNELERIDPHNPLLQFGFHGLPFLGWKGD